MLLKHKTVNGTLKTLWTRFLNIFPNRDVVYSMKRINVITQNELG